MKKIGILLTITILIIIFSISVEATSVNCTYGVNFQNDSVWNITGNNITICDHENLDLYNVTLNVSDNATLIFNGTNLTFNNSEGTHWYFNDESELIVIENSNINGNEQLEINMLNNSTASINNSYGGSIAGWNTSTITIYSSNLDFVYLLEEASTNIYNSNVSFSANENSSIYINNSKLTSSLFNGYIQATIENSYSEGSYEVTVSPMDNQNINIQNIISQEYSTGNITSDNSNFEVILNNVSIQLKLIGASNNNSIIVNNSKLDFMLGGYEIKYLINTTITFYNSTIYDIFGYSNLIRNEPKVIFINSNISSPIEVFGKPTINFTNTTVSNISVGGNTIINCLGNDNTFDYLEIINYTNSNFKTVTINGNLTPTTYNYDAQNQSLNRSFFINTNLGSGKIIKVLDDLDDVNDYYYANLTNSDGDTIVYMYFENSSDVDYLYYSLQNTSVTASSAKNYVIPFTIDTIGPAITINATSTLISAQSFSFFVNGTEISNATYNISQGTTTWSNGSLSISLTDYNDSKTFGGIYLPVGLWNITIDAYDEYNNHNSEYATINSTYAITTSLTSDSEQEAYIGDDDIEYIFEIYTKGYRDIKAYLNITNNLAGQFNTAYAALYKSGTYYDIANNPQYTGAEAYSLTTIAESDIPSYVTLNISAYNIYHEEEVSMLITPYSGLSAGTYEGTYGFGLDDGS